MGGEEASPQNISPKLVFKHYKDSSMHQGFEGDVAAAFSQLVQVSTSRATCYNNLCGALAICIEGPDHLSYDTTLEPFETTKLSQLEKSHHNLVNVASLFCCTWHYMYIKGFFY